MSRRPIVKYDLPRPKTRVTRQNPEQIPRDISEKENIQNKGNSKTTVVSAIVSREGLASLSNENTKDEEQLTTKDTAVRHKKQSRATTKAMETNKNTSDHSDDEQVSTSRLAAVGTKSRANTTGKNTKAYEKTTVRNDSSDSHDNEHSMSPRRAADAARTRTNTKSKNPKSRPTHKAAPTNKNSSFEDSDEEQPVTSRRAAVATKSKENTRNKNTKDNRADKTTLTDRYESSDYYDDDQSISPRRATVSSNRQTNTVGNRTRDAANTARNQPNISRRKQFQPTKIENLIQKLQSTCQLIIPVNPFSRLVREILLGLDVNLVLFRMTRDAFTCLQESTENYLVQLFEDSYRCTMHRDRVTLTPKDMALVRYLRGRSDPGCG